MTRTQELTDEQYEAADVLNEALEQADQAGLTISAAARKARITYDTAAVVLAWMVTEQYIHTSGNGAWRHYHAGRGR
jgi:hypothetical protein